MNRRWFPWIAGAIAAAIAAVAAHGRHTPYDNYVLLAQAWLQGRMPIQWPGPYIDALPYHGAHYVIEAPFPALLLVPWVAFTGGANQTVLAIVLCGVAIGACWRTCEHLGVADGPNAVVCAFYLAGTQLLWSAMLGDVWFIASVAACACTSVALMEATGARRGWLVALAAACACFSRFALVMAIPVFAYLVLRGRSATDVRRAALGFGGVVVAGAAVWISYNLARWGTWYDIGYTAWYHEDAAGSPTGSPFQLRYLGYELSSFFVQGPQFSAAFPYVTPTMNGLALTWCSPALAVACFARRPRDLVVALWTATVLVAAPSFIYYVNGFAQFGMRHALDFEPFLVVLMALAIPRTVPVLARVAVAWSVLVNLWGVWYWNTFYRPGP